MAINWFPNNGDWSYYGYHDWWWKRAIEMYIHLTGDLPKRVDKGSVTQAIYWQEGRVAIHRLTYCLRAEEQHHAGYLRTVARFWEDHANLADLMLPKKQAHATIR